ncbi:ATP-dependent DNA helicase [Candidatus Woesearchaeota archaeon]|nr:ATP-dependent DNA helicase [Candidatus Woesearchaeota archaeon]
MELLFPHDNVRDSQQELVKDIQDAIVKKRSIICHAPTGLGKTAASLAPALTHAIEQGLTVFFLTSRHTQHLITIETLKDIKNKHSNAKFSAVDIIGKKWMCCVPGTDLLSSFEFSEYCKAQREEGKCEFFNNLKTKGKLSAKASKLLKQLIDINPCHTEKMIELCTEKKLCPYEITTMLASKASVIVADYNYVFNTSIRDTFFSRANKTLESAIVIVDEGHNLPIRVRDMLTQNLSSISLRNAIKEAKKFQFEECAAYLEHLLAILEELENGLNNKNNNENLVEKQWFIDKVNEFNDYHTIIGDLEYAAGEVREIKKRSFIGSIAQFLVKWLGEDEGFARIFAKTFTKRGENLTLSYRCLDPSIITSGVIKQTHSTILMSGTLTPTSMYKDVLGFPTETAEKEYPSPFPEQNKLCLIVPETTTKFTQRDESQFKRIAEITADIANAIPGNSIIFFPSYYLRDQVDRYFTFLCRKTTISEERNLSKEDKIQLLDKFKEYKDVGAVMLAVYSGSFGEGVDLPGDLLKCVIVVGVPLQKPDLETQELIRYYDKLFGKGWDYGYLFPAMNRCFQSSGRCIRSETDRGAIVFLDQRFTWPNYFRCFPSDWEIKISREYMLKVDEFFKKQEK